jgi:hypothetical protein
MLNFVEDHGWRVLIQESPRISDCSRSNIGRFKRDISAIFSEQVFQRSGFARLPWSREDYGRKFPYGLFQNPFYAPFNVVRNHGLLNAKICVIMHYDGIIAQTCQGKAG